MSVRESLEKSIGTPSGNDEARRWLARTEVFLEWVAQHPHLFEINCEAARLLAMYRGADVQAVHVDYRGVAPRPKSDAVAYR